MKFSEIKSKTQDELQKIFIDLKKELYNISLLSANGEYKKTSRIKDIKLDIAKILTFLRQNKSTK
jgi:large subunit ribosomal protein L29